MSTNARSPHRLVVEGIDDQYSIINLLTRHGYNWDATGSPFVHKAEGIDKLLESLAVALKTYERLGVVVDADVDLAARWEQIRGRIRAAGIDLPDLPPEGGLVVRREQRPTRVGVWLMPNNQTTGMLEDFLATLLPAADPCWPHAVESTGRAIALGAPLQPIHRAKGELHAWLAWQADPGMPFGQAITARVLSHDSPEALRFVAWFLELFGA
jgi:hypothetical protein